MQKRVRCFLAAVAAGCILAGSVSAKVWLLPDYQAKQFFSDRTGTPDQNPGGVSVSCGDYGGIAKSSLEPGMVCNGEFSIKGLTCCRNMTCAPEYKFSEEQCRSAGKIASGSSCGGLYTKCICDTSLYPYTSSSCATELSGASCTDSDGTVRYEICEEDPCTNAADVMWCPTERCTHACGSNHCLKTECDTTCDAGSRWVEGTGCVATMCETGYSTSTEGCATQGFSLVSNSKWALDATATRGAVDSIPCQKCDMVCQSGYADYDNYWCSKVPQTVDCAALGYTRETSSGLVLKGCANGATKIRCPFDTSYFKCVGELTVAAVFPTEPEPTPEPEPDPEPVASCSDFDTGLTNYTIACIADSNQTCLPSSYSDGKTSRICKFATGCAIDSDCSKYISVDMPGSINSEEDINAYGEQVCHSTYPGNDGIDLLLWADPQCSNPDKLCIRCDTTQACGSEFNLDTCPEGGFCSYCGGKAKFLGCDRCYATYDNYCLYRQGVTLEIMCQHVAPYYYSSDFSCENEYQTAADIEQCHTALDVIANNMGDESEGGETDPSVICDTYFAEHPEEGQVTSCP